MTYVSRIPKFHAKTPSERMDFLQWKTDVDPSSLEAASLSIDAANKMIENCVGVFGLPLGIAANFLVDNEPVLVPMCVEEPSVIAACSNMAAKIGLSGGFRTEVMDPVMTGQIWLTNVRDFDRVKSIIQDNQGELVGMANELCPGMVQRGGGCRGVELSSHSLCISIHLDVRDAMGANIVNTVCEALAPRIQELCGSEILMSILTNYCDKRMANASFTIPFRAMARGKNGDDGERICRRIVDANRIAKSDPHRACTHNKGIFNGVDAVAIATGNDWRAIEAAGHTFACRDGVYCGLTDYWIDEDKGELCGSLSLPMAVGVVGGSTKSHPTTKACLQILGDFGLSAKKLAGLMVSVGLAQNLGALRALVCEGIQDGHMRLHGRKHGDGI